MTALDVLGDRVEHASSCPVQAWDTADCECGLTAALADLEATLRETDDLLRRLAEWDMLSTSPQGVPATADAPFWQREIATGRAALARVLGTEQDTA